MRKQNAPAVIFWTLCAAGLLSASTAFVLANSSGWSWNDPQPCLSEGILQDQLFVRKAVSQSLRPSKHSKYFVEGEYSQEDDGFSGRFLKEYPDCCRIYNGPPGDKFSPPTFYQKLTKTIAKVVEITFARENILNAEYTSNRASIFVRLDACGNNILE